MTVYLVGAGPGDPGLLTRRGAELLERADVVVYDRLVDPALLLLARDGAELVDVGKAPAPSGSRPGDPGGASPSQEEINRLLVDRGRAGHTVVRLKGGDPFVFGRGGEEAMALTAAGVDWVVVPGVSSAFAVAAAAGIPVTHRGLATSVSVVTGNVGDPIADGVDWESLGRAGGTLVILMGVATRGEIAERLMAAGRPSGTPVTVVSSGTTRSQRTGRTTLGRLGSVPVESPAVIVVGEVAGIELGGRPPGPLAGRSVVVTRPRHQVGSFVDALSEAGAHVVPLPVVDVADPEDGGAALDLALQAIGAYAWVVFTSANAVDRTLGRLADVRALGPAKVAAVGPATARALAGHHLVADLVPDQADAAGLAAAFPDAAVPGARVLFPAAAGARPTLARGVAAKGWAVDQVTAYRTVPAAPPPPAALGPLQAADAVVFASPSAVEAYLAMRVDGNPLPVPSVVACIGPVTAGAARAAGLAVAAEAESPTADALVRALVEALADVTENATGNATENATEGATEGAPKGAPGRRLSSPAAP